MTVVSLPVPIDRNRSPSPRLFAGWSEADLGLLRDLWTAGAGLAEIATRLGRSKEAVRSRARRMRLATRRARRGALPPANSDRECLNCRATFASQGAHNRLCETCREGSGDFRVAL